MTTHLAHNTSEDYFHATIRLQSMLEVCVDLPVLLCAIGGSIIQCLQLVSESLRGLFDIARSNIEFNATPYTHLNIILPRLHIRPDNPAIVGQHPIELALHIRRLGPDGTRARIQLNLQQQLTQQKMTAEIPIIERGVHLVRLVDAIDRIFDLPKMLRRNIVP